MRLSAIAYHYVRPLTRSRWPRLRGLELDDFRSQLAYLKRNYTIVSLPEIIDALDGGDLPQNACLLTFDDGYADHYQHVFPLLHDAKVSGAFFPIGRSVAERWVADANKIHFIIHEANPPWIVDRCKIISGERPSVPGRFDDADTAFVKRVLQASPGDVVDDLFRSIVLTDADGGPCVFDDLYMTSEQIKVMHANGMHFGVHGWNHVRFSRMTETDLDADVSASVAFLRGLGVLPERWAAAYPYGTKEDINESAWQTLARHGCKAAFTTQTEQSDPWYALPMLLPRLDTNDIPRA